MSQQLRIARQRLALLACVIGVVGLLSVGGCPPMTTGDDPNSTTDSGGSGGGTDGGGIEDIPDPGDTGGGDTGGGDTDGDTGGGDAGGGSTTPGDSASGDDGTGPNTSESAGGDTDAPADGETGDGGGDPPAPSITRQQIAATGDNVPGQPSGTTFTQFGDPVIDDSGRVAFWALYEGTSARGSGGLYVWNGTELVKAIDDDPASAGVVPPGDTNDYFGFIDSATALARDIVWGADGRLLFSCEIKGDRDSTGVYRWRASDGNLVRVADADQVAPLFENASNAFIPPNFRLPGVGDDGVAFFAGEFRYFTEPPGAQLVDGDALFSSTGTAVRIVASTHSAEAAAVPAAPAANTFFATLDVLTTISSNGDKVFSGTFTGGSFGTGVYLSRDRTNYRVIDSRSNGNWNGLTSGAAFSSTGFPRTAISSASHIAIDGRLTVDGQTADAVLLWDFVQGEWYELTGPNSAAAEALVSGVNDDGRVVLLSGGTPYIVGGGIRVQLNTTVPSELSGATLTWDSSGGSINNHGRALLGYSRDGGPGLVFWNGDTLLLVADAAAGVPANVAELHTLTHTQEDRPGRSGALNDDDAMTFRVVNSNGNEAIYLAQAQ